ncbi:MAG: hypothetical protein JWN78_841 [Bacteroidota bacterium]|nr:hypothetical protein [Bacteroidota bacterium]
MHDFLEFFKSLLKTNPAVGISVTVSLSIFIAGILADYVRKRITKYFQIRAYKRTLHFLLYDFATSCLIYSDGIRKSLENAGLLKGLGFTIKKSVITALPSLLQIRMEDFIIKFTSFHSKKRAAAISKIFEKIITINQECKDSDELAKSMNGEISKYTDLYNKGINDLSRFQEEIVHAYNKGDIELEDDTLQQDFLELYNSWIASGAHRSIGKTFAQIVLPSIAVAQKYSKDVRALRLISSAKDCHAAYNNMANFDKMLLFHYESQVGSFEKAAYDILDAMHIIFPKRWNTSVLKNAAS